MAIARCREEVIEIMALATADAANRSESRAGRQASPLASRRMARPRTGRGDRWQHDYWDEEMQRISAARTAKLEMISRLRITGYEHTNIRERFATARSQKVAGAE